MSKRRHGESAEDHKARMQVRQACRATNESTSWKHRPKAPPPSPEEARKVAQDMHALLAIAGGLSAQAHLQIAQTRLARMRKA